MVKLGHEWMSNYIPYETTDMIIYFALIRVD